MVYKGGALVACGGAGALEFPKGVFPCDKSHWLLVPGVSLEFQNHHFPTKRKRQTTAPQRLQILQTTDIYD